MIVLELPQGHYRNLSGMPQVAAILMFVQDDDAFLAKHPQCAPYHRPLWWLREVDDTTTAPFGHEWYWVDADGRLQWHSALYDSSD